MPVAQGRAYGVFIANTPLQPGDYFLESLQDNITAKAGGGAGGFQITTQTSRITTVATAADSVVLPPSTPGLELLVINHGANAMQVFGNAGDQIDDQAATAGVSQMANSLVIYTCTSVGNYYSEGLGTGFSKSLGLQTLQYAVVAASTTNTQIGGTPITASVNHVTATSNPGAVTLPPSTPGLQITIALATASDAVSVFPNAGGTGTEAINALGANNAISMGALTSATFICAVAGQWFTVPRVPS